MTVEVHFRGGRQLARDTARRLVATLTGRAADDLGLARGVFTVMGLAALTDIKADFVRKARGGVGEDGVKWKPLSEKYLAYQRRFGSREKAKLKKAAGLGRAHRTAPGNREGLLTVAQLKRWRGIYSGLLRRFSVSMPIREAKAKAAACAWIRLKQEGARTMLEVYGHRQVEILRDTGVLLNSLSPGTLTTGPQPSYQKPDGDGGQEQVFDLFDAGVMVGTSVAYAAAHQDGIPGRLVARPFLPVGAVPKVWLQRWQDKTAAAITSAAKLFFEAA